MKEGLLIALLLMGFIGQSLAQKYKVDFDMEERHATIYMPEYTIEVTFLEDQKEIKAKPELWYTWYRSNMMMTTHGGYDGKLLHGEYVEFYPERNLRSEGLFFRGLKDGVWKYWYPGGEMRKMEKWDNGILDGPFIEYGKDGSKTKEGNYVKGQLHGWVKEYEAGKVSRKVKMNHGEELPAKTPKEKQPKEDSKKKNNKGSKTDDVGNEKPKDKEPKKSKEKLVREEKKKTDKPIEDNSQEKSRKKNEDKKPKTKN